MRAVLAALVLAVALQELALRAVFPLPEVASFDRAQFSHLAFVARDAAPEPLGHRSFRWASDPDGFEFVHRLNLYGFRDVEWRVAKPAGAERVMFVGDSFVEGFSADAEDTLPAVFREATRADVLNLGVGGGDLPAYAKLLGAAAPVFQPDHVILVIFANDVLPTRFDPAWLAPSPAPAAASPWAPRLAWVLGRARAGERAPRRWIEPPFEFLPAVPDPRNPWSHGRRAGQYEAFVEPDIASAIRAGRFNPMVVEALPWFRKHLPREIEIGAHLRGLRDFTAGHGGALRVVYLPTKNQVSDAYLAAQARFSPPGSAEGSLLAPEYQVQARLLAESCAALGLPFLDLTPALREREAQGERLYWEYDDHMRAAGYRLTAEAIVSWWASPAATRGSRSGAPRGRTRDTTTPTGGRRTGGS